MVPAVEESLAQLRIEATDSTLAGAEPIGGTAAALDLLDIDTGPGLLAEFNDELVGDRAAALPW